MANVFISYSSKDSDFVDRLKRALEQHTYKVWLDRWEIHGGVSIPEAIQQGLHNANYVIVVLSINSVKSKWVECEWQAAYWQEIKDGSVTVIPLLLEECAVPLLLQAIHTIDFRSSFSDGLPQLMNTLYELEKSQCHRQKKKVWFLDNNAVSLKQFSARHGEVFEIRIFDNVVELMNCLMEVSNAPHFPDVLLTDLYAPLEALHVDLKLLAKTEKALSVFMDGVATLKESVDNAWNPSGVAIVKAVRSIYEKLPILLYTQRGLILLDDDALIQLEHLDVGWLLKNQFSADTERLFLTKNIGYNGREHTDKQGSILYIDDNEKFLSQFVKRHQEHFHIECIQDQGQLLPLLDTMKRQDRFPDLLLVDLYYPKGNSTRDEQRINAANKKLRDFKKQQEKLRQLIKKTHDPFGMNVVQQVRKTWPDRAALPILIYSRFGLLVLEDAALQKIEEQDASWLFKNRYGICTERVKILGEIARSQVLSAKPR